MDEKTENIVEALQEVCDDTTIPKNLKDKLHNIISYLQEEGETSIKIDKALHDLESISEDTNLQSYTRTQIWNIVSLLEMNN